jgi:dihydrofolate reductase
VSRPRVNLIVAWAHGGVIGRDGAMPWHLPQDLAHFKQTTLDHPVIMGRRTWESLPAKVRPLPGRRNIVLSTDPGWSAAGAQRCTSLQEALARCAGDDDVWVIGGARVYEAALPLADRLVVTEIDADMAGDTHFPAWDRQAFVETMRRAHQAAAPGGLRYDIVVYQRRDRSRPGN